MFDKAHAFDEDPDLCQLENCLLDLKTNRFRIVKAPDMCQKRSPLIVPEEWLMSPHLIDDASRVSRHMAWNVTVSFQLSLIMNPVAPTWCVPRCPPRATPPRRQGTLADAVSLGRGGGAPSSPGPATAAGKNGS